MKCSHCRKLFSEENFGIHECDLPLKGVKIIPVVYFRDDSFKNIKTMTGRGVDGVFYSFEVTPRKPIPVTMPLRRKKTGWKSDADETAPGERRVS